MDTDIHTVGTQGLPWAAFTPIECDASTWHSNTWYRKPKTCPIGTKYMISDAYRFTAGVK